MFGNIGNAEDVKMEPMAQVLCEPQMHHGVADTVTPTMSDEVSLMTREVINRHRN